MRELLLIGMVGAGSLAALVAPQIGLLGYIWFALMRPDMWAWSRALPYSFLLAVTTFLGSARYLVRLNELFKNPIVLAVLFLQVPIGLSVIAAVSPELAVPPYWRYIRTVLMATLIPLLILDLTWFFRLYMVIVGSLGLMAARIGAFSALHGGVHMAEGYGTGYGGMMMDSNGLALGMAMLVPLAWYGRELVPQRWLKLGFIGLTALTLIVIVSTHSRGNTLAAAAALGVIVWRTKYKVTGLVAAAVLTAPAIYLGGQAYTERMSTLGDIEDDASAYSRLPMAMAALRMWSDYPLTGVGWGEENFTALAPQYLGRFTKLVVHNTYVQTLVDSGIFALILYLVANWGTIIWLGRAARRLRHIGHRHGYAYCVGLQTSLIAWSLGSTFYSRADFELFYFVLLSAAAFYPLYHRIMAEQPSEAAAEPQTNLSVRHPAPALPVPARRPVSGLATSRYSRETCPGPPFSRR